jgi:phage tail sheath protein FI
MATSYLTPGVYIEEKPSGSKPIQGAGTSVAAFVGFTEKRPAGNSGQPVFVSSWTQFVEDFGGFAPGFYLPHSVYGYFLNGGSSCFVQSLATKEDAERASRGGPARAALPARTGVGALELRSKLEGQAAQSIQVEISDASGEGVTDDQFKVTIKAPGRPDEVFDNLTMGKAKGARNAVEVLTRESRVLQAIEIEGAGTLAERRPQNGTYTLATPTSTALATAKTFEGSASARTGIGALEAIDEVTMLVCPDLMSGYMAGKLTREDVLAVQKAMLNHCEAMKDRFAILDALPGLSPQEVNDWRMKEAMFNSKYGALYYPWIYVANPNPQNGAGNTIMVPPSGHIAGLYARVDSERGVHKAPANEQVRGALRLEKQLIDSEQALLNPNGINCIRAFPGRGIVVWGARTLSDDAEWRYINVRRLFNYIEESIKQGTQWVVFEPNDVDLWERVRRTISSFLTRVWRDGALFGTTPQEAFYVKCDAELNIPAVRDAGMLIVEIGIAPVKPAEFVIFRLSQFQGGAGVEE